MGTSFPFLRSWMDKTPQEHPLHDYVDQAIRDGASNSVASAFSAAFENIIEALEKARPQRIDSVRGDFCGARAPDDLLIVRAELVAGAMLARSGVPFDFGRRNSSTEPDLVLREINLGTEVKARRLDDLRDLRDLHDELEDALAGIEPPVLVHLMPYSQPLIIKRDVRAKVIEETVQRVGAGDLGTVVTEVDQPWPARKRLLLNIGIYHPDGFSNGSRVTLANAFWNSEPGPHLLDAEERSSAPLGRYSPRPGTPAPASRRSPNVPTSASAPSTTTSSPRRSCSRQRWWTPWRSSARLSTSG